MIVAFYDPTNGSILEVMHAPLETIKAQGKRYAELPEFRVDWDSTHRIIGGLPVAIPDEELKAAKIKDAVRAIRLLRDVKLATEVDSFSPVRYAALSDQNKAILAAYRQALLDFPEKVADPLNPVWPVLTFV